MDFAMFGMMGLWANMVHVESRLSGVPALTSLSFKLRVDVGQREIPERIESTHRFDADTD